MTDNQRLDAQEQVAQLEYTLQTKLSVLDAFEQMREICPGYVLDLASGEYERLTRQVAQAHQQLTEAKSNIALMCNHRDLVTRMIKALQSL